MRLVFNLLLISICFHSILYGQYLSNASIGLSLGISQSGTDTHTWGQNKEGLFSESHALYGAHFNLRINHSFSTSINFTKTRISGDDENIESLQYRGWKFESPLSEVSLNFRWNLLGIMRAKRRQIFNAEGKRIKFTNSKIFSQKYFSHVGDLINPYQFKSQKHVWRPYLLLGISSTHVDPNVDFRNTAPRPDLLESDIEKQKSQYFHLSLGAGINLYITDRLSLDAEIKGVIPQTDLLDGISRTILEFNNERNKDSYQFALLRINYSLAEVKNCDVDELEDRFDKCPCLPGSIELWGCPDSDADGIPDINDQCPLEKGIKSLNGCPDADADGIPDINDECPQTYGLYLFDGCPDRDADGIPDKDDECPDTPGSKSRNGCPL